MHIVVNADDFGMSEGVNRAILKSFNLGWISTTTLICNMAGFEEACNIVHENKLVDRIGIHLNLTEGLPLTDGIKKLNKFCCKDGIMFKSFKGHFLDSEEKQAVYYELEAQLNRLKNFGITPVHIDSHHHSHHSMDIGRIVIELAKEYNIHAVRLRFNWGKISVQRKILSAVYNTRLRFNNLAKTSYFCEIKDVTNQLINKNVPTEVMVHPYPGGNGRILNYKNGPDLGSLITKYLVKKDFITYDYLVRKSAGTG